jgi:hypothetical protein
VHSKERDLASKVALLSCAVVCQQQSQTVALLLAFCPTQLPKGRDKRFKAMASETDHVSALTQALDTIECRFHVSGTHKAPMSLIVGSSTARFPMSLADAAQQLAELRQQARPSAFGR